MAVHYEVEVDVDKAEKQLDQLSSKFEDAFNAGRAFNGNNLALKQLISKTSTYLKQLKKEYADTVESLEAKGVDTGKNKYLARLKDDIKAVESELDGLRENMKERRMSSENMFAGIAQGARGVMGAFTAAQGAAAMFGAEEEKLQKIQTKLQASMSILMGLQQLGNTLQSTSQFRVQVLNKLYEAWHKWNLKLAASEGLKKAAMLGVVGAIAAAGVAITALIIKFSKYSEEIKKAKELQDEWKKGFASAASTEMSTFVKLQAQWKATNGDLREQQMLIARNKSEFESLGFAVNTVEQAENLLVKNKDAVVQSIMDRAKAAAYLAQVNTLVAESIDLQAQMESKKANSEYKPNWWQRNISGNIAGLMAMSSIDYWMDHGVIDRKDKLSGVSTWENFKKGFQTGKQNYLAGREFSNQYEDDKRMRELREKIKEASDAYAEALTGGSEVDKRNFQQQQAKQSEAIAQAQRARLQLLYKNEQEEIKARREIQEQIVDAEIAAMEEGYEKERLTREKANQRELEAINRAKAEFVEAAKARAKAEFDAEEAIKKAKNPDYVVKQFDETGFTVDTSMFDKLFSATQTRQYADNLHRILEENSDFVREFNKIWDEFNGKQEELFLASMNISPEEYERALNKLLNMQQDKLAQFARNLASSGEDAGFTKWAKEVEKMNLEELQKKLKTLENWFNRLAASGDYTDEEMVKLQASIALLKSTIKEFNEKDGGELELTFRDWSSAIAVMRDTFNDLGDKIGGAFGEVTKSIGETLSKIQSVRASLHTIETSKDSSEIFAAKMDIVSQAISGVIELIGMYVNAVKDAKKAEEEWQMTMRKSEHALAMLRIAEYDYQQSNIFGVENPYSKAIAGATQYAAALGELNKMQDQWNEGQVQTGTKRESTWGNFFKGMGAGALSGAALGTIIPGIGNAVGAAVGAVVGSIVGLASTKVTPIFESLTEHYGALYDENYKLNQQLIADYDKLDDATKQIVDNWDEIVEKMKEAEEQMRENFHDLAGDLGDKLSDALVAAFKNGKIDSALSSFKDTVNGTLESILEQAVFSAVFQDIFSNLENEMMDSFSGSNADYDLTDDVMRFDKVWRERIGQYEDQMKAMQDYYKSQGYDLWSKDNARSAATKAISGVTQESFDEALGRFTAMQSHTYEMNEAMRTMREQQAFLVQATAAILLEVQGIHQDTMRMQEALDAMQGDMMIVRSNVVNMNDKGVRMLN